jgi:hypothetical protein
VTTVNIEENIKQIELCLSSSLFVVDVAPLVDCSDTATSLFKFLNESNDEIGQLMTQFSPPPTPVSSVTSTTQQCLPMCAKPVATSANTAAIPGVYIMQGHAASLVYVNSFSNAVNPAIATEQEMGIKTEALSPGRHMTCVTMR